MIKREKSVETSWNSMPGSQSLFLEQIKPKNLYLTPNMLEGPFQTTLELQNELDALVDIVNEKRKWVDPNYGLDAVMQCINEKTFRVYPIDVVPELIRRTRSVSLAIKESSFRIQSLPFVPDLKINEFMQNLSSLKQQNDFFPFFFSKEGVIDDILKDMEKIEFLKEKARKLKKKESDIVQMIKSAFPEFEKSNKGFHDLSKTVLEKFHSYSVRKKANSECYNHQALLDLNNGKLWARALGLDENSLESKLLK